jgi:hypothetical protein
MMANTPVKKVAGNKSETPDYFKLPFEVYYSEAIPVTQYQFKTNIDLKSFKDVKAVHKEQGSSWGASFSCPKNNGPELYCCLINGHDEVKPSWLQFEEESDIDFNYGCNYAVVIDGGKINFAEPTEEQEDEGSEEYLDMDNMDYCCSYAYDAYELGEATPDYIILDAKNTRIKIDLDGYELDDEDNRIESRRIINTDELDGEQYEDYETLELFDTKFAWVKSILEKDFPKDKSLSLEWGTE